MGLFKGKILIIYFLAFVLFSCGDSPSSNQEENPTNTNQEEQEEERYNPVKDSAIWEMELNDGGGLKGYSNISQNKYDILLRDFHDNSFYVYLYYEPYQNLGTIEFPNSSDFLKGYTTYKSSLEGNYGQIHREFDVSCSNSTNIDTLTVLDLNFSNPEYIDAKGITNIINYEICGEK